MTPTETAQTCVQAQASSESPSQKNKKAVFQITCSNCGTVQQIAAESAPRQLSGCRYCPNPEDEARRRELAFDAPAPEQNIHRLGMKKRQPRADRQALKEFSAGIRKLQKLSPGELNAEIARGRRIAELDAAVLIAKLIEVEEIAVCLTSDERAAVRLVVIDRKPHREVEAITGISRGNLTPKVRQCIAKLAARAQEVLVDDVDRGPMPPALAKFEEHLHEMEYVLACSEDPDPEYNVSFKELCGPSEKARRRDDYKDCAENYQEDSAP